MKIRENKAHKLNVAYLGGGSRGWAWRLMADLALEESLSGMVRLYDLDFAAAQENEAIGNSLLQRPETKGKWRYQAVTSLKEALSGADFVIISILPGTFQEMASDVHTPEEYGIYQSVGDTVGPGGLMRALRTIPIYVDFAEKIRAYSPKAWVINYTNPMSLCTRTLYEVFPGIKAFGCCHEVFHTQDLLAAMLADIAGIKGLTRNDIKINVLGINHFTWINQATYQGTDLFPMYRAFVDKYYTEGFQLAGEANWQDDVFRCANRVKFDLFKKYGLIAAAGDRHLAEFMPAKMYLKDPATVEQWRFQLTPVRFRIKQKEDNDRFRSRVIAGEEQFPLTPSGEEGVRQIKALVGLDDLVTNINLPNQGQMEGVPAGAVIETNALLTGGQLRPVVAGAFPSDVQNLTIRHIYNQETILQAALKKDVNLAFRAFINDPLVQIDPQQAEALFTRMLENIKEYLPGWVN